MQKLKSAVVALGVLSTLSLHAIAETTAEDAADYRTALMTSLRGHIGAASMIARGLVEDEGYLVNHARGLASSAKELHRLFPAGSNVGESEALPLIWEEPEAFAEAVVKLEQTTAAFVEAAEGGDEEAIGAAFREVGTACRGCHDRYRVAE